jgi:hypothetical protein
MNTEETLNYIDEKFGIKQAFVYHCNRCDYLWLPKDFDVYGQHRKSQDIFNLVPPKVCARCKTKLWNKPRKRKMRVIKNPANPLQTKPWVSLPRIKAIARQLKRVNTMYENAKTEFQKVKGEDTPRPVIKIQTRKKRKLKL